MSGAVTANLGKELREHALLSLIKSGAGLFVRNLIVVFWKSLGKVSRIYVAFLFKSVLKCYQCFLFSYKN